MNLMKDTSVIRRHPMGIEKQALLQPLETCDRCRDLDTVAEQSWKRGKCGEEKETKQDAAGEDRETLLVHSWVGLCFSGAQML